MKDHSLLLENILGHFFYKRFKYFIPLEPHGGLIYSPLLSMIILWNYYLNTKSIFIFFCEPKLIFWFYIMT